MSKLFLIAKRDVKTYYTNFYGVGFRTVYLCVQILVFGYILGRMVPSQLVGGMTYLQFFALGSIVISLFGASYTIGRDVYWDRESGFLNYLLALPISRTDIVMGRALGGAIRSLLNMLVLYIIALILAPTALVNILQCVLLLFTLSIGLCSLGILLATVIRQESRWRLVVGVLDLLIIRSSTTMYPVEAMPTWLQIGARMNPLSYASDSIRSITFSNSFIPLAWNNIVVVVIFSLAMGMLGITLYSRKVEASALE